ncbi:hypothetical protein [Lentilitoribacter sp. EG35]|uniref:hypothetical protein n=1 Tax=Lentilitoribacter sp. EG35 TaxID=3234192 RepID=UPI003460C1CB
MKNTSNFLKTRTTTTLIALLATCVTVAAAPTMDYTPGSTPGPTTAPAPSSTEPRQQNSESNHSTFKVCFYTEKDFEGRSFCRRAPSRVGVLNSRLRNNIRSIKITNSSGGKIAGPNIKLKLCDNVWRKGNCQIIDSSQPDLSNVYSSGIVSYAFDVRS